MANDSAYLQAYRSLQEGVAELGGKRLPRATRCLDEVRTLQQSAGAQTGGRWEAKRSEAKRLIDEGIAEVGKLQAKLVDFQALSTSAAGCMPAERNHRKLMHRRLSDRLAAIAKSYEVQIQRFIKYSQSPQAQRPAAAASPYDVSYEGRSKGDSESDRSRRSSNAVQHPLGDATAPADHGTRAQANEASTTTSTIRSGDRPAAAHHSQQQPPLNPLAQLATRALGAVKTVDEAAIKKGWDGFVVAARETGTALRNDLAAQSGIVGDPLRQFTSSTAAEQRPEHREGGFVDLSEDSADDRAAESAGGGGSGGGYNVSYDKISQASSSRISRPQSPALRAEPTATTGAATQEPAQKPYASSGFDGFEELCPRPGPDESALEEGRASALKRMADNMGALQAIYTELGEGVGDSQHDQNLDQLESHVINTSWSTGSALREVAVAARREAGRSVRNVGICAGVFGLGALWVVVSCW